MGKARTHMWQRALLKEGGSGIPKTRITLNYNRGWGSLVIRGRMHDTVHLWGICYKLSRDGSTATAIPPTELILCDIQGLQFPHDWTMFTMVASLTLTPPSWRTSSLKETGRLLGTQGPDWHGNAHASFAGKGANIKQPLLKWDLNYMLSNLCQNRLWELYLHSLKE